MANLNLMLIPTSVYLHPTSKGSPAQTAHWQGIVIDQNGEELWYSPVLRTTRAEAETDAQEAVDAIAYTRRHQLELQLYPSPIDQHHSDPYSYAVSTIKGCGGDATLDRNQR